MQGLEPSEPKGWNDKKDEKAKGDSEGGIAESRLSADSLELDNSTESA